LVQIFLKVVGDVLKIYITDWNSGSNMACFRG
jgi:hypothetical protein